MGLDRMVGSVVHDHCTLGFKVRQQFLFHPLQEVGPIHFAVTDTSGRRSFVDQ